MASTYTSNIRLEKQADGENPNAWGAILNTNVIDLVDQAVAAYQIVSVSGTTPITLTQVNGATDQSRKAILSFDGTLTAETSIIIPSVNKMYYVRNNTSGSFALKIKTAGNTAITIEQGSNVMVASDGTDVYQTAFPTSVSSFTANSFTATSVSTNVLNATKVSTSIMTAAQVSATAIHATSVSAVSGRFSGTVSASAFDGLGNKLSFGSDAQGDVYYYSGNSIARLAAGTDGQFLQTKGSSANPVFAFADVVQVEHTADSSYLQTSGTLTIDDTIPTTTEAPINSSLNVTITPKSASNTLMIEMNIQFALSAVGYIVGCIFKDSGVNALAVSSKYISVTGTTNSIVLRYFENAASTSSRTYKVGAGSTSGTVNYNGSAGGRLFGGVAFSSLTVTEFTS